MRLLERLDGYMEPLFLSYDSSQAKLSIINDLADGEEPLISFVDSRHAIHEMWPIHDPERIKEICGFFDNIKDFYICDGHHRIAAAAEYVKAHPEDNVTHVMVVVFPSDETNILDYNRAVSDLNGLSDEEFIEALKNAGFTVEEAGTKPIRPEVSREYTMAIDDTWYRLKYQGPVDNINPVSGLDAAILQEKVIKDILGITDPRADERLTFVSGTKGLEGLRKALQNNMKVAFVIRPATMEEIINVAGAGLTMPPKSTCFEPKPVIGILLDRF